MNTKVTFLNRSWKDQSGAGAPEIAIILAIIGLALAGATILLSGSISQALNGL